MMKSEHLLEEENDFPQSLLPLNASNIRSREAIVHVHHDSDVQQGLGQSENRSSSGLQPQTEHKSNTTTNKNNLFNKLQFFFRRNTPRHNHTNGNGHGNRNVAIDVDENYAKYGKRRLMKKQRRPKNMVLLFTACSAFSFISGFYWMLQSYEPSASSSQKLRHPNDSPTQSKVHQRRPPEPQTTPKIITDSLTGAEKSNHQSEEANQLPILIPKFDSRSFVKSWEENAKNAAQNLSLIKHPQSISLKGWNYPSAFRIFPWAKQAQGPMKDGSKDYTTTPQYGVIDYHSLKNEEEFARYIPEDDDEFIAPGAFDADSIEPDVKENRKSRGWKAKKAPLPKKSEEDSELKSLPHDATYEELRAFYDDDTIKLEKRLNDGTKTPRACHPQSIESLYFPVCNAFHELDLGRAFDDPEEIINPRPENSMTKIKYLNHGFYRDVWVMEDNQWIWPDHHEEVEDKPDETYGVIDEETTAELVTKAYRSAALKTFRWNQKMTDENLEMIQAEAIIMERLTKSPRIMNIYGHCAFSVSVEVVPIEFEEVVVDYGGEGYYSMEEVEKRNKDGLHPYNDFTPSEKLGYALEMAESIADLHGFEDGVIVHDDVQLCQWLHTTDGRLKLGDFNRATIMDWDTENEEYCKFNNGEAFGNYRAPEEFAIKYLDEKIDIFSFGNNIYALLTGLWVFHDTDDDVGVHDKLIDKTLPYIDPRYREGSFAEKKLVELMEKCWFYDPAERVSIFEAVEFLREAIREDALLNKEE